MILNPYRWCLNPYRWCLNPYRWCLNPYRWCLNPYRWCLNPYRWCLNPYRWWKKKPGTASCLPLSLRGGSMGNCLDSWTARGRQRWEELNELQHGRRVCLCVCCTIYLFSFMGRGRFCYSYLTVFVFQKELRIWTKKLAYPSYPIGSI